MRNFCPFCKNPLTPWYQWKASDGRFYCNEYCADAGETPVEFTLSGVESPDRPTPRA
jgi:hypothetical protein